MSRIAGGLRRFRMELAVSLATTLLLCLVWTVFSVTAATNEQRAVETGLADARDASRVVAAAWEEKLAEINALQYLAVSIVNAGAHAGTEQTNLVAAVEEAMTSSGLEIVRVYGTDADGIVQWTTDHPLPHTTDVSDRPDFRALKDDGADHFISGPLAGKLDGRFTSHFAKAVRNPDGTLRATIVVVVNSSIINQVTAEYLSMRHGVATVMRADGTVIARNKDFRPGSVTPGAAGGPVDRAASSGEAAERRVSRVDGVERFFVTRRTRGDMLVGVGLDVDDILAPVRLQTIQYRAAAGLVSLALLCNAVAMIIGLRYRAKLKRQHQQARDLVKQEELITQIAERATDIFTLIDAELRIIYQNPAGARLLDVNPRTLLGRRFGFAVAAEDEGIFKAALTNLVWFGGSHRLTYRVAQADGTRRWLETEMIAITPGQGAVASASRFIAVSRDVTMRKRDEEVLRETQTQIAAMLRHGGLLYCRPQGQDGAGRIDVSPLSATMVLGYTRNCLMQPGFFASRIHPDDKAAIDAALQRCEASGDAVVEYRFSDAAGNLRWLREQMTLANRDEIASEIVVYVTDITDEHTDRMRLQQSERLATLGMVTTNIAHEMNQPLAAIGMAAENGLRALEKSMASRGFGEEAAAEQGFKLDLAVAAKLRQITSQTRRVASVISHIRKFGRADDSKPELLDVKCVIDEALLLSEPRLLAAGVRAVLDIEPNLPLLRTLRVPLEQVLLNITVNACDAYDGIAASRDEMADRPLFLSARRSPSGLLLRIADRAGGIPPDTLNYIFDPFFTTKPVGAGTGVGLFVSKKNINGLNGKLFALNEDGGAVFEIHLPLTMELEERDAEESRAGALTR